MSENIFKNIEGNFYCLSKNIRVFPCAYRGYYSSEGADTKVFDPEAKSTTEANFTNTFHKVSANKESYVISWDDTHKVLKCVIGGYYFEISNYEIEDFFYTEGDEPKSYHLCIKTADIELGTDEADGGRKTPILSSFAETENYLDVLLSGTNTDDTDDIYIFTGLTLKKSTTDSDVTASLAPFIAHYTYEIEGSVSEENKQIGKYYLDSKNNYIKINTGDSIKNGTITYKRTISYEVDPSALPITSLLDTGTGRYSIRVIEDYTGQSTNTTVASGDYSIALGRNTAAVGNYSITTGTDTTANGEASFAGGSASETKTKNSFAFGNNVKTNAENQVVFGKNNTEDKDQLFILANGEPTTNTKSNKFTVSYNGDVKALGTATIEGATTLNSTLTTKGNITADGSESNNLILGSKTNGSYGSIKVYGKDSSEVFSVTQNGSTTIAGITKINNDTESTSTAKGALKITGGVGVGKNLNVGGDANLNSKLIVKTSPTDTETNVKVNGTLNVTGKTTIYSNVTVDSDKTTLEKPVEITDTSDYALRVKGNITTEGVVKSIGTTDTSTNDTLVTKDYVDGKITNLKSTLKGYTDNISKENAQNNNIVPTVKAVSTHVSTAISGIWTEDGINNDTSSTKQSLKTIILDAIYPIGSIYMHHIHKDELSGVSECPIQGSLGGEWELIDAGKFLRATDGKDYGQTGGSADAVVVSHNHNYDGDAVIVSNGAHTHAVYFYATPTGKGDWTGFEGNAGDDVGDFEHWKNEDREVAGNVEKTGEHSHAIKLPSIKLNTDKDGKTISGTNANLPPYLNVYMWKRVK